MTKESTVRKLLSSLGFDSDASKLYEAAWNHGSQTISELARTSGVERTKVYRLLPLLKERGLIEIDSEYSRDIIRIAPPEALQELLAQRQTALQSAQLSLPALIAQRTERQLDASRVNVYRGASGLKQLLWNETRATGEILCVLQEPMQSSTNQEFFERWVTKCNEKELHMRGVVGSGFSGSRDKWYETHVNERLAHWQERTIDNEVFSVDHNMVIYDDTVAYFTWNHKDMFGVEIHQAAVAQTQRQFFELLWRAADAPVKS